MESRWLQGNFLTVKEYTRGVDEVDNSLSYCIALLLLSEILETKKGGFFGWWFQAFFQLDSKRLHR